MCKYFCSLTVYRFNEDITSRSPCILYLIYIPLARIRISTKMNSIIFSLLFALFSFTSAQDYYRCSSYYNAPNGTLCCYKQSYYNSYSYYYYYSTYYPYCPYLTTTSPPAPSTSPPCRSYYYSYLYSGICCYKTIGSYSQYSSYYYYYTTSDCQLSTTPAKYPIYDDQCQYTYYNTYYSTDCCSFLNSYNYGYTQYCPTANSLSGLCPSYSCCSANVPVRNGSSTFYYTTYHCPSDAIDTYCGPNCIMAVVFSIAGICCCICGLGLSISALVFTGLLFYEKFDKHAPKSKSKYVVTPRCRSDEGLLNFADTEHRQEWDRGSASHHNQSIYVNESVTHQPVCATAPGHEEVKVNL